MTKCETCVLKCGTRLVLCEDKTKNKTFMEIIVNYGSLTKKFELDGKVHEIKPGVAHLIEHSLIENSCYGNMFDYLSDKFVLINAYTSPKRTVFYMETVDKAMERLVELINLVNTTSFDDDLLDKTKKPVLEEVKLVKDRLYEEFSIASLNAVLSKNTFRNNLGENEDVNSCTADYLKFIHDVFYRPENQVIAISGNFDSKEVKKIIEDTFAKIAFKDYNYKLLDPLEDDNISKPLVKLVKPDLDEIVKISFKVNIRNLTPKEQVKLSFYGNYFLEYNFGDSSEIFKTIKKEKLSPFSVSKSINSIYQNYLIISFSLIGNNIERFKELVFDIMEKKPMDDEMFELMKKQSIIDLIERNEDCSRMLYPYLSNIIDYNYYEEDKLTDIEEFSKADFLELLNRLDFSHYSISVQAKE